MLLNFMKIGDSFDFEQVLLDLTHSLNQTVSRSLGGVSPSELVNNNYNAIDKMRRATKPELYWSGDQRAAFFKGVEQRIIASPGDYVRVTTMAEMFEKLTQRKYSNKQLYVVDQVRYPTPSMRTMYSMYRLMDTEHHVIEGLFLTSEIIPLKDHLSPKNPNFRYTVTKWQKSTTPGMYWVTYDGK